MSLLGRISKFARSPQGKKLMTKAEQIAKDPKTKAKIEEARERIQHKDRPAAANQAPAADPAPAAGNPPQAPANPPSSANPPAGGSSPPPGASS